MEDRSSIHLGFESSTQQTTPKFIRRQLSLSNVNSNFCIMPEHTFRILAVRQQFDAVMQFL